MTFGEFLDTAIIETDNFRFTYWNLILIVIILVVARGISMVTERVLRRALAKRIRQGEGRRFAIISIVKYAIFVLAILLILTNSGLDLTVLLAGSTALLVGLGFGLQNMFKDLVSGVILLFEGSIEVNDVVEVDKVVGRVLFIGFRVSRIQTLDGVMIIVPNSKFVEENVINYTHQTHQTRFHVAVGAAYGSDPTVVRRALLQVADNHPKVAQKPLPTVRLVEFGESAIRFELLFWTTQNFAMEDIKSDLRFRIFEAFKKNDIRIPFPQRDLHIKEIKGDVPPVAE